MTTMMRAIVLLLLVALTGCRLPSLLPHATAPGVSAPQAGAVILRGQIEGYQAVASLFDDIAQGATMALIDSETGHTLGTSITTPQGAFQMSFGASFRPVEGRAYYLDLVKGVRLDPSDPTSPFNQVGADALRLRNVLFYQAAPAGWKSLMSATASNTVGIGNRSTALSIGLALKRQAGETVVLSDYIGALAADPYVTVGSLTATTFEKLYLVVKEAIEQDRDPLHYVVYDPNQSTFLSAYVGFAISDVIPKQGGIGTEITITGNGFSTGVPVVAVNGVQATIVGSPTGDTIRAKVAPGSRTGPVSVTIGNTLQAGPTFKVDFQDGHSAMLNGKLYVANPEWNTVVEIASNGNVTTVWNGDSIADLRTPSQVAVWGAKLYVSCRGTGKILRLDPGNPALVEVFNQAALTNPYGLAFDATGNLYVSSYQASPNGAVVKLSPAGAQLAQYAGLDRPRGIVFDYLGNLFAAEEGGRIVKHTAPTMASEPYGVVPSPIGLAADSAGDLFVASNSNDVIYRITRFRNSSVFAMINRPGGLTFDEKGYLYVSDTDRNLISRISPLGDSKVYAYGISNPRGLAVDPANGTLYVALNQSNAILKVESGILKPFVTGIANPMTLRFRGDGMLIAHPETETISFARRDGNLTTLATGLLLPGGADQAVDGSGNLTGPLYVGRLGDMEAGNAARLPRFGSWSLSNGDYSGVEVVSAGVPTLRRWLYRQQISYLAVDGTNTMFAIHVGDRTLTRIAWYTDGGAANTSRHLRQLCGPRAPSQFPADPAWVTLDRDGNVYVAVPGAGKIFRFVKSLDYAKEEIAGFSRPWGIAFSDTTPQAMFVSDLDSGTNTVKIRRVSNPATAALPDAEGTFVISGLPNTIRGLAYMATATPGTGTLYMANGSRVEKAGISGNGYVASSYGNYFTGLPVAWTYLYARASTGEVFGYGDYTFAHKITPGAPPVASAYMDYTGWSRLRGFTFDPSFGLWRMEEQFGGLSNLSAINTTREIELDGNTLYVASPDSTGGGGVLRIDLNTGRELYVPLTSYSLGLHAGSGDLYVGATDNKIYKVDPAGKHAPVWDLGTTPYGLDVRGATVWAVGADSRVFEGAIGGGLTGHKFGMKGPVF